MTNFLNKAFAYTLGTIIALTFFGWLSMGLLVAYETVSLFISLVVGDV